MDPLAIRSWMMPDAIGVWEEAENLRAEAELGKRDSLTPFLPLGIYYQSGTPRR